MSAGYNDSIQGTVEAVERNGLSTSCGQKKFSNNEGSLTLLEPKSTYQMEISLDPKGPILVQSQTSKMLLGETDKQDLEMKSMAVQNQPLHGPTPPVQAERRSAREAMVARQ